MTYKSLIILVIFLLVGVSVSTAQTVTLSDSIINQNGIKYYIHKVEKKQTLYSIARIYQTTIDVIKSLNQFTADGLSENQYLKIPYKPISGTTVLAIPPTKLPPSTTTNPIVAPIELKPVFNISTDNNAFNIVILLPLYLKDNLNLNFSTDKELQSTSMIKPFNFIGFLEGTLMAIDSAKKQGHAISISILDEVEDTISIKEYLKAPEMQYVDLLIGPFFNTTINITANFIKQHNTKSSRKLFMLAPLLYNAELIKSNPYIIKTTPAVDLQIAQLAAFTITDTLKANNILLSTKDPNDQKHSKLFKNLCLTSSSNYLIRDLQWNATDPNIWNTFKNQLRLDIPNNLFMFSNNEAFISSIIRKIIVEYKDYQIILHGLPTWQNFESIEPFMLQQLNTHIFTSSFINYESKNTQQFISNFKSKYNFFPDKYAIQGFDVSWLIVNTSTSGIENSIPLSPDKTIEGLQSSFSFNKKEGMGYENTYITIFKYADYKAVKVNN